MRHNVCGESNSPHRGSMMWTNFSWDFIPIENLLFYSVVWSLLAELTPIICCQMHRKHSGICTNNAKYLRSVSRCWHKPRKSELTVQKICTYCPRGLVIQIALLLTKISSRHCFEMMKSLENLFCIIDPEWWKLFLHCWHPRWRVTATLFLLIVWRHN